VSGFAAAFFVDKFDRKKFLLFAYGGFLIGTLFCGIAPNYPLLLMARIFAGLFGGMIGAQVLSIISDIFPYEERGKAMGSVMSAFAVASTLGVPFALYIANAFSWHAPFIFVVILGLAIYPFLYRYIPAMDKHLKQQKEHGPFYALQQVTGDQKQMLALLFSFLMMMGHFLIIPFINPFMEFNRGYSKMQTPMIYLAGGAASFIAANILGRWADKYGKLRVFVSCLLLSLGLVMLITHLPQVPFPIVLSFFAIWFVFSTGRAVTAQAMLSNVVPAAQRGSFMSFNSSVQQLGTSTASFVAGMVVTAGVDGKLMHYGWLGWLSVAVLLVCLAVGMKIFK
jgi:predicted MFS family arabinose efflux permease